MKELYEYQSSVNNRKETGEKKKREYGNPNEAEDEHIYQG